MNAEQLLEHAAGVITRRPVRSGRRTLVAALGTKVSPAQVVLCMIDLKLAASRGLEALPDDRQFGADVAGWHDRS